MGKMKISVVIPTLNRPEMIVESLKSVINQTVSDLEIIVVDGSNNDDTERQIDLLNDERIRYFKIKNHSAANSRNIGIAKSTGDFVAFNDDDDVWCSNKIEKQIACIKNISCPKIVYCSFTKLRRKKTTIIPDNKTQIQNKGCYIYNTILQKNFIGLPTVILPLACCREVMFDENLYCLEDWDWIIRLAQKYPFQFIDESLVLAGDTPQSVNKSSYKKKAASYERIYNKYMTDIQLVPPKEAKHLLSIGNNLYLAGEIKKARKYLLKSLKLDSKNPKIIAACLLSLMGTNLYYYCFKMFEFLTHSEP